MKNANGHVNMGIKLKSYAVTCDHSQDPLLNWDYTVFYPWVPVIENAASLRFLITGNDFGCPLGVPDIWSILYIIANTKNKKRSECSCE